MQKEQNWIVGCGDIGRRIARLLEPSSVKAIVRTELSAQACTEVAGDVVQLDFDQAKRLRDWSDGDVGDCVIKTLFYLVPPQPEGVSDKRTENFLSAFATLDTLGSLTSLAPKKVVIISTTGVYGDCDGEWVTEQTALRPKAERAHRRLSLETQWLAWGKKHKIDVVILRVPGIYAFDRLPKKRLRAATPVVFAHECGYTNRIHADDLAQVALAAAERGKAYEAYNATDGTPGKIADYLQAAAQVLGLPVLPEITMAQAQQTLSSGMLSYLAESRKISNQKMLDELKVELKYPDFRKGILS